MGDPLAEVAQWITDAVYAFGYVGVFVLTFLGNLHLPVPTQLTLPLSGYLVWEGRFSFIAVMVASTTAAVAVSFVFYYLGACASEESLHRLVGRYGRFVLVRESDLNKASREFERHGGKAILVGHLVPGIGAFISIPAGIEIKAPMPGTRWPTRIAFPPWRSNSLLALFRSDSRTSTNRPYRPASRCKLSSLAHAPR